MKLFSEKVDVTSTNSSFNIIAVEAFEEIFFGVYEIEINKTKYPVEKVSDYKGNPVVSVPVVVEGKKEYYPFVLIQGKPEIIFNENNTMYKMVDNFEVIEDNILNIEPVDYSPTLIEDNINVPPLIDNKQEILLQIKQAKKEALIYSETVKRKKLREASKEILEKNKALDDMIVDARSSLVEEFISVSKKIKGEFINEADNRFSEIEVTIDNKINDLSDSLYESLKKDFNDSAKQFDKKVKELVSEIYNSLQPKIDDELKSIATEIVEKVDSIEKNLDSKLKNKADIQLIENVEGGLNSISKANIELNDKINKGVNKALSRVGNISTKVDELTIALSEEVENKISKVENNISNFYTEKLKLLEEKTFDLTEETRKYIIDLVTESRDNLIREIREIKNEKPIEYVVESKGKKQSINSDDLLKEFDKKINSKVDNEVTRLRRYIAVYSGGGSVAMQFANGGTMGGNLTVLGAISASQYLGISTSSSSNYLPISGNNNYTGSLSVISSTLSSVPFTIQGAVGQTANLQEWKNGNNTTIVNIGKTGQLNLSSGSVASPILTVGGDPSSGIYASVASRVDVSCAGTRIGGFYASGLYMDDAKYLGWNTGRMWLDSNNVLALRNTTSPQTFNIYNTYTNSSEYERGFLKWTTNVLQIGTESLGTGIGRNLQFAPGGNTAMIILSSGNVGIGTTTPNKKLTIVGELSSTGDIYYGLATSPCTFSKDGTGRILLNSSSGAGVAIYGSLLMQGSIAVIKSSAAATFSWSSTSNAGDVSDTAISRIGPGKVAIGNGTAGNTSGTLVLSSLSATNFVQANSYQSSDGSVGATGSFTSQDGKTVTVKNGLITSIV
jgi:hypothetical protein